MKVVIQRVSEASVKVDGKTVGNIGQGFMILVGIGADDDQLDMDYLIKKITGLRVFNDQNGVMNCALQEVNGEILLISQFTLMASTKKGNRPSYIKAASPSIAEPLFNTFKTQLNQAISTEIQTGIFGADMKVSLCNDGPVTITIDSKNKQ